MYTVLAITCHPDDMEFYCCGTLLKCKARGDRVVVCHLCSGNLGHEIIESDELKKMRAAEAQKSCAIGGFEVVYGGFDDLDIYDNNKAARDKVVDVIRTVNPDFIITHNPQDYMPDHVATSRLVFDASFAATVPHYVSKEMSVSSNVPIYYMDTYAGIDFQPAEYVDVTPYIEKKLEMLKCHKSQLDWMLDHDGIDFTEVVRSVCRHRGIQCNVQYAEGFKPCNAALKLTTKRFLP